MRRFRTQRLSNGDLGRTHSLSFFATLGRPKIATGVETVKTIVHVVGARPNYMKIAPLMDALKNAPGIVDLNLHFAEYVTDEGLAAIKSWKKLKRLNIHGTKISDTTLEHISGITTLEYLNIGSAMITDVGLERLSSLTNLKELTIGGNELGDAGLQALRQLPGLTYLDLSGRQGTASNVWTISMSDAGLDAVLTLKELRELRFGCTSLGVGVEGTRFATVGPQLA